MTSNESRLRKLQRLSLYAYGVLISILVALLYFSESLRQFLSLDPPVRSDGLISLEMIEARSMERSTRRAELSEQLMRLRPEAVEPKLAACYKSCDTKLTKKPTPAQKSKPSQEADSMAMLAPASEARRGQFIASSGAPPPQTEQITARAEKQESRTGSSPRPNPTESPTAPVIAATAAAMSSLAALVGVFLTTLLAWRKERRESYHTAVELEKKSLEITELRKKLERPP
jgi:hypothetical protein